MSFEEHFISVTERTLLAVYLPKLQDIENTVLAQGPNSDSGDLETLRECLQSSKLALAKLISTLDQADRSDATATERMFVIDLVDGVRVMLSALQPNSLRAGSEPAPALLEEIMETISRLSENIGIGMLVLGRMRLTGASNSRLRVN